LAGTVDARVLTFVSGAMNAGAAVAAVDEAVVVLDAPVLADAVAEDLLVLLEPEPPQPASASIAAARARTDVLRISADLLSDDE